jgi:hypothetical protein
MEHYELEDFLKKRAKYEVVNIPIKSYLIETRVKEIKVSY